MSARSSPRNFPVSRAPFCSRARRRGASLWLFVISLPMIFGTCGLVIDLGQLHARRAQAQRAADASALAGALCSGTNNGTVIPKALHYADINGFSAARGDEVIVNPNFDSGAADNAANTNTVRVLIKHNEPVYFAPVAETLLSFLGWSEGAAQFSRVIGTRAVARKFVFLPMSTGGNYGIASGSEAVVNNIINGPYSAYDDADPYSGKYLLDGSPNTRNAQYGGYQNFSFHVSDDFQKKASDGKVYLQIYDPGASSYPHNGYIRQTPKFPDGVTPPPRAVTTTKYEILKDGKVIASKEYGPNPDPDSDMKWTTPDGFALDLNTYGVGDYKVRVSTSDGNTSNNYALRAGPVEGLTLDDHTWNDQFGDKLGTAPSNVAVPMNADGRLTIGFQTNGTASLKLGYLGKEFAGRTVQVSHYDLDIGATGLNYSIDSLPDKTFPGTLPQGHIDGARDIPGNGLWATDTITLPIDFQGGNLQAQYAAGVNDLGKDGSAWELIGEGDGDGFVRLIE